MGSEGIEVRYDELVSEVRYRTGGGYHLETPELTIGLLMVERLERIAEALEVITAGERRCSDD